MCATESVKAFAILVVANDELATCQLDVSVRWLRESGTLQRCVLFEF